MRLKPGITAKQAAEQLDEALRDLGNQRGGGRREPVRAYIRWVGDAEHRLYQLFREPHVVNGLHSARYESLLRKMIDEPSPHVSSAPSGGADISILYQEIEYQHARLIELKQQLDGLLALASRPGDEILVYDTNSLMHYQPPNRIKWSEVLPQAGLVRVVVPLCVIYELDQKAHLGSDKMAGRARAAAKALREIMNGVGAGQPARLLYPDTQTPLGASLEVLLEESGHQRLPQIDDEIIDRASLLRGITGRRVRVITHDINMILRAQAHALETVELPTEYMKDRSPGMSREST